MALDTNLTYRWSGTAYVKISKSLGLGETSSTAYRGDRGKTAYDHSQATGNVHGTTASQIPNTPAGTIAATTVQGAINELAGDIVQVETNLNLKINKTSVKQVTGTSETDVMSQKAVTDGLGTKANHGYGANPKTLKEVDNSVNAFNISSMYPTGGTGGNSYYTLETAVAKVTADIAKVGMSITFRLNSTLNESYRLTGGSGRSK